MPFWRKYGMITPVKIAIAFLVAGGAFWVAVGNQSKVSQCHRLILLVNQENYLIAQKQGKQTATTNQLVRNLDGVNQKLAAVNLRDQELKGFKNRFFKGFQALSQALGNAGKALDSARIAKFTPAGRAKVVKAKLKIQLEGKAALNAATQHELLAGEINQYCTEK